MRNCPNRAPHFAHRWSTFLRFSRCPGIKPPPPPVPHCWVPPGEITGFTILGRDGKEIARADGMSITLVPNMTLTPSFHIGVKERT